MEPPGLCSGESAGLVEDARRDRVRSSDRRDAHELHGRVSNRVHRERIGAPTLRWKEGDTLTLRVANTLDEDASIHWHGIILPANMDGVPGLSVHGIRPNETYVYQFTVKQGGTYWYHSHSGFQEQRGLYGPLVIDPVKPEPFTYDREHVVMLTDWTDEDPARVFAKLGKTSRCRSPRTPK